MAAKQKLGSRVAEVANQTLEHEGKVSALDVFLGLRWLNGDLLEQWYRRQTVSLQSLMQSKPEKHLQALKEFENWANNKSLQPIRAAYYPKSRWQTQELRITEDGTREFEERFRQVFLPPDADNRQKRKIQEKAQEKHDVIVYIGRRETNCSACGKELGKGSLFTLEKGEVLCLSCAELDHLVFLERGDATLTRRTRKYSSEYAVVVQWSRRRKRYERQGILVEPWALEKAEQECIEDQDKRAAQRKKAAKRRQQLDIRHREQVLQRLTEMFPNAPREQLDDIADHTTERGSGRVGRTADAKQLDEETLRLAVIAAIRHGYTNYDGLLMQGFERAEARREVADKVSEILDSWERES